MKRRASDLEQDETSQRKDVDVLPLNQADLPPDLSASGRVESQERELQALIPDGDIDLVGHAHDSTLDMANSQGENPSISNPREGRPSIDDQIRAVTEVCENAANSDPLPGTRTYLVSKRWLARVQARASGAKANPEELEGEIGPVDNSDIVQEIIKGGDGTPFARLKSDLSNDSFVYFPEQAWDYIVALYGIRSGDVPIVRKAHNTNPDPMGIPNMQYELHPPVFALHRLWSLHSPVPLPQLLKAVDPEAPVIVMSRSDIYVELLRKMKKLASVELSKKIRIWKVPQSLPAGVPVSKTKCTDLSPPTSRSNTPASEPPADPQKLWKKLLVDVETFLKLERDVQRQIVDTPDHSSNPNYNGHTSIDMAGLGADQALVIDELVEGSDYLSQFVPKLSKSVPLSGSRSSTTLNKPDFESGRNSPAPSGPLTRGRAQRNGRTLGTVGLSNLGNTCYMNSALQCVRSVEELTKYFLTEEADKELNKDNPLGNNGEVAMSYSHLLHDIYKEPVPSSVTPRYFKQTIGRYAPSFSGYGQQDSQEFLGFLLDGLQEDLSRIKKKPYIEKPDSTDEMVGNPEAIREMAAKVWDITKRRDDSVIADLFTGMYKSTLVCPVCAKVSITFDPFNNLTLQLPIESTWSHTIRYFPMNERPIRIVVDMDKNSSIKAMKDFISKRVNVPAERLFVAENYKSRFFKFLDDYKTVSEEIQGNDDIAVYELEAVPTNWPPPKKPTKQKARSMLSFSGYTESDDDDIPRWDDPMSERMIVPIYHRKQSKQDKGRWKRWEHVSVPHFIIVSPTEAKSEDSIRRKILEQVGTLTTHPAFNIEEDDEEDEAGDANENVDPDLVVTTASDADSSGDGKVMATSVDGEDDVVDVTMKDSKGFHDAAERDEQPAQHDHQDRWSQSQKRKLGSRRPKWADPKEYLRPEFQNLFDLSYYSGTKELVPVGWNVVDEDKEFSSLSSREPHQTVEDPEDSSSESNQGTGLETSTNDNEVDVFPQPSNTRMNEESSDEDEIAHSVSVPRALPVRPVAQRLGVRVGYGGRRIRMKTYSRKGSKPAVQPQNFEDNADHSLKGGPLIRLGEGIVVDWNAQAWDAMFAGDRDDDMRARPTYVNMDVLEDPELDAKRKARVNRRKRGLTLDECLDEFGKEEILSEMDTWYCPRCKEHRRASKKFELWKTPDILVMHLKRFSSSAMRRDKLDIEVDFPIEGLDLSPRVMEQEEGKAEIYDLFAVDDHWGGLGGGHYTAFAKSFVDGEWYEYNDSSVSKQKDTSRIVSSGAYLLFYRRRSDVPLGGPRFKEIVERYDNPPQPSEDESEPGEDQRLDANSSLHGSSSALIGVGAAHQANGLGGMQTNRRLSGGPNPTEPRINPSSLNELPSYRDNMQEDDGAPLLARDAAMNDGFGLDEGIDMGGSGMNYSNLKANQVSDSIYSNNWNFANIEPSKIAAPSDADSIDSDAVQHNSSASEGSLRGRLDDFDHAEVDSAEWEAPSPIPDADEDAQMDMFSRHVKVPAETMRHDEADEEVAEINVEEGEGLKTV
ncbi:MAG: CSN-associated deubiquitinating enzyme Ubp12 [Claussenomyces sp. TS43310]|nr:MAG: CSN-associated deubiquitinating enzyme Ubp12 [Claussenomyces sp. TS43310]